MIGSDLHKAALTYAKNGIPVFVCVPGTKRPATPRGFKDATTDPAVIGAWFAADDFNVAIHPGAAGLAVIDTDPPDGETNLEGLELIHGPLPETHTVRTPRGGRHRYFKGSLPPTASRLAAGIDTRGEGSYVLVPPSRTDDGVYVLETAKKAAPLPGWMSEALATTKLERVKAAPGLELGKPEYDAEFAAYLRSAEPAVEGQGGDARTLQVAMWGHDMGVLEDRCFELMAEEYNPRCTPEWSVDELRTKIGNAYAYAQNEPGCYAPDTRPASEVFKDFELPTPEVEPARDERLERFRGREPDEYAALPAPTFHDDHGLLLKAPGGVVGVLAGPSGSYKTTVMLALVLDAALTKGAKVLYMAPEGSYGLGRLRVPAECAVREIEPKALRGRFRQLDTAPILTDPRDVDALLEAQADFRPDIVIIDTMASALGGLDENAASTGALLTGTGPLRRIARTWNATVMLLAHLGKDAARGIRGTSAFHGNADTVLLLKPEKAAGAVTLHVDKQRDARDGFDVHFRIGHACSVPIARYITADEHKALSPTDPGNAQHDVFHTLRRLHLANPSAAITTDILAAELCPPIEGESPEDRERRTYNETKRLQGLTRPNRHTKAPGVLLAYVQTDHRGEAVKPLRWVFPGDPDDGGEDD